MNDIETRDIERIAELMKSPNAIFVFGSNRGGRHGGGAARVAWQRYGAVWSIGEGLAGRSYALPTKHDPSESLTLDQVAGHVNRFLAVALAHPDLTFAVTRIGCGFAGFTDADIAPLFADAPANCELPDGWRELNAREPGAAS